MLCLKHARVTCCSFADQMYTVNGRIFNNIDIQRDLMVQDLIEFKRLLDRDMIMEGIEGHNSRASIEGITSTWHHVEHRQYRLEGLFRCCTLQCKRPNKQIRMEVGWRIKMVDNMLNCSAKQSPNLHLVSQTSQARLKGKGIALSPKT